MSNRVAIFALLSTVIVAVSGSNDARAQGAVPGGEASPTTPAEPAPTGSAPPATAPSAGAPAAPPPERQAPPALGTPVAESPGFVGSEKQAADSTEDKPIVPAATDDPLAWARAITIGGGATLWYYQPLLPHTKNNVEFYNVRLTADGAWGAFGFHLEPRFRDTKLRPYFDAPVWIQEGYAFARLGKLLIKVGKEYSRLGLFWDDSFYGNVQVYDGLKLAPDYGISAEGQAGGKLGLRYIGQYFVVDGRTNVSLENRDTVSVTGARRRNEVVGRLEPYAKLGTGGEVAVGLSAQYLRADFGGSHDDVGRYAADVTLLYKGLGVWGEVLRQNGRHVIDFPYAGRSSRKNDYLLVGAEYTLGSFTLRYNASLGSYRDVSYKEWLHVPGLGYSVNPHLCFLGELVFWRRFAPEGNSWADKSINITMNATL